MSAAIIFTGLPRAVLFNKDIINKLSEEHDIFFITNKNNLKLEQSLSKRVSIHYIEDDADELNIQKELLTIPEASKALQWQKLMYAMKIIENREKLREFRYSSIFKLRTDLIYGNDFNFKLHSMDISPGVCFMDTDLYFGAERDTFKIISSFFTSVFKYYESYDYKPFPIENIKYCDLDSGRFSWLTYPLKVRDNFKSFEEFSSSDLSQFSRFSKSHYAGHCFWERRMNVKFSSEASFLHFILSNNLITKKFDFKLKILPLRKLEHDIFNTNKSNSQHEYQNINGIRRKYFNDLYSLAVTYESIDKEKALFLFKIASKTNRLSRKARKKTIEITNLINRNFHSQ